MDNQRKIQMTDHTRYALMDQAERLAIQAFGEYAEAEHIEAVFERLVWAWERGLGVDGVVTVH